MNETQIGYYYGYLLSAFSIAQFISVILWGYLSDRFGRRPLLLTGMLSATISALLLAFSQSYKWVFVLVVAKGLCTPSLGAARSAVGDISSGADQAKAFRLLFTMLVAGSTVGPVVTGGLADIRDYLPDVLKNTKLLHQFPYFLPFIFNALLSFTGFLAIFFYFNESLPSRILRNSFEDNTDANINNLLKDETSLLRPPENEILIYNNAVDVVNDLQQFLPSEKQHQENGIKKAWSTMRNHTILLASICAFQLTDGMLENLFSLWIATPIKAGGLSMDASDSGIIAGISGVASFLSQILVYSNLQNYYGSAGLYRLALLQLSPLSLITPSINILAKIGSTEANVWVWICVLVSTCYRGMVEITALTSLQLILTETIRDTGSLGVMNGANHCVASLAGAIGPLAAGAAWSWSISNEKAFPFDYTLSWNVIAIGVIVIWIFSRKLL
ncbi:major facilitator superfamily domain-containing protein [Syncephalis fuscata]|nr:major facilitator superfamily domain-containing protein [Syncephalis fuscata]